MSKIFKRFSSKIKAVIAWVLLLAMVSEAPMALLAAPLDNFNPIIGAQTADEFGFFDDFYDDYYGDYYLEDEDQPEFYEDWYGIDEDERMAAYPGEETANPEETPPVRMTDAEILEFALAPLSATAHEIGNYVQLQAFLDGTLGENHDHFRLTEDINMTGQTPTQGRPGEFTGIFDGGGNTITGLQLRPVAEPGLVGIGFVRQAGHGAVIRNLNFYGASWLDEITGANWINTTTGVGIAVGRTAALPRDGNRQPIATITIDNVRLNGHTLMRQNRATAANVLPNMRIGGLAGDVSLNTVLNIIDIRIQNLDIHSQTGQIRAAGGVVGHVNGGTLNLITRRAGHINAIGVTTRGGGDTNLVNNAHRAGGVLGFLQTGHAFIEDVTITENSSIHAISMAGGIVGGSEHIGSVTIRNAINDATFVSVTARGTAHDGRVGGIFGRARNTVVITNTVNNARVQQHNFENWNSALGGIIGYTGPASFVTIEYTENMGQVLHNAGTNANLGGIIGRSRGRVTINRSSNHGHINKTAGTGANVRVGGIIGLGQLNGFMNITDTYNRGQISTTGDITGGIIGDLWAGGRAVATLRNVRNYNHPDFVGSPGNTITGARQAGGIVGWARSPNMIIDGAFNERPIAVTATGFTTHNPSSAGGIVGRAGGSGLTIRNAENRGDIMPTGTPATRTDGGGIVSHSNAWGLTIENSVNYGHIRANYRVGGILAYAIGNNATLSNVMNHGRVEGTSHANINAGGIVARSERHNLLIRNAGNTGHVSVLSGTNNNAHNGVGGIVGHSRAHNLIIESSFNQGFIEGANATGGIVGRNQAGSLIIRDVYNTGTVHGFVVRSGNGILGRRVSGNVHIARTWVSANVRGYSVATFERSGDLLQRATNHNLSWHMTVGITFDQVYVDLSTVSAASPGDFVDSGLNHHSRCQTRRHDADARQNRSGRIIGVTTELLTSGLLPGINSGVWMTGIHGVETHIQSTFPYFTWQVPTPEGQQQPQQQSSFFNHIRLTGEDFDPDNPEDRRYVLMDLDRQGSTQVTFHGVALHGARVFHPYLPSSAGNFPEIGGGTSNLTPFVRGTAAAALPASIGLISPNHVIAFETGPLPDRFIIRAYDSESGEYIIDHIEFDFGTGFDNFDMFMPGFAPIPLTGDRNPDGIPYAQDNPGMLIIQNALDIPQETRLNFTVNALGYTPSVQNNIQIVSGATHSVAMTREPFEVRVWVRDFLPENENVIDDALGPVVANASLSRIRPPAPDRTNIPPEANHSFDMDDAMIGDNLEARAHLRSHEDRTLATRDLVWRGGNWELDIFAQHIGFGPIRINFVTEELNADGEVITRPVDTRGLSQDRVLIYNFYNNPDPAPLRRANFPLSPWGINMGLDGDISALATFDIITPDDVYPQRWQHQYNLAIADFIEFDELGRPITNEPITIVLHPIQEFDAQVIWTIGGHRLPVTGVDHFWHNPDPTEEVEDGEIPQIGLIPGGINGRFEVPTRPLLNEFRIEAPGFGTTTRIMPRDEVEAQLEIDRESGDSYVELEVFRALPGRQSLDGFVLCADSGRPLSYLHDGTHVMIYNMDGALTATLQPNEHGYFYTPSQRGYFRVVASSRGFAPALSTVSPTWVGPTGGNADILLTPIEAGDPEYLLLASLQITTPDDSGITIDDAYLVLRTGEGDTPLDFGDDGMWRMPSNSPLEGDVVVVLPGQTDPYILIPVEYRPIDAGSYHHNVAMVFLYVVALPPPDPGHGTIFGFVYCQCFANPNERLPGTEVSLPGLGRTAETDERGFYFFHNVPFGTHNLFVSDPPDGFNSAISEDGPAVLNETYRTAQLDFYLRLIEVEAYAIVWGRVFDYEHPQQPGIAGATVQLTHYPHYTPTPRPPATTHIAQTVQATTDSQGFFVIGPVARNHDLLVRATHDYFSIYTGEMRVYENQDHRERNIGMINFDGTTVRVRVHDESESNAPQNLLPNAEVLLILPDGRGVLEGRTRPNIDNNDIIEAVFHLSRGLLDELRNGTDPIRFDYFVQLDGFDIVFDYFDLPHPSPDELEPPVYVALSSGGFQALLWGRVYDERDPEDDVPLLTATVWPPSKLQPGGNSHEDVDPEDLVSDTVIGGYYFIIVSSAEINAIFAQSNILNMIFIAEAPGFSTAAVDLDLEVGRTLRHDFFLNALENHDDPQPLLLLGNVTSYVGGQPVGGATVAVAYTHGFGYVDRPYRVSAMTDDLGAYVIIDIPAGQHDVRATASGRFGAAYDEITVVNQNVRRDFALPSTVDVEIRLYVDARSDNNHYYTEMLRNLPAGTVGAENFRVNLPDLSAFGEGYMLDLTDPPQPNFRTINLATWNSADDYVFWIIIPAQREIEVHHVLPMPAFDDDGDPIDGEYDYKLFAMGDIIYAPANTRATAQAYIGPDYRLVDFRIIHIDEDGNEVDPHPFDPQPSLNREASPAELTFMVAPDKTQRVEFIYELTIEVSVRGVIGHFEYGVLVYNDDPPYLYHHIRHLNANTPEVLIPFTNLSSVLYRIDWIVVDAAGEPVDYVLREGDGIVIDVGVENIQITFVYRDLNTVVQINAFEVNEQGEVIGEPDPENIGSFLQIPGFPMMIPAVEGRELPVPPPAIPGFVWVYSPDGESIVPSAEYDNSLTFHYVRSVGNLTVHAVEYGTGRTIRTISRNIAYGDDYTVIFDQLLPGRWYYTLSAGQSVGQQTFTYDDTPAVLNVYFDRVLRDVTVRAVLAGTGELLATVENYGSHRGGEFALISVDAIRNLPALEGFIPVMTEMPIMIGETDNVVTFFFIVDPDPYRHVDIVVELREYPNNELIDSFTIRARRGETITINAPERMGWHLHSTPDYRRITVPLTGAVDNVVFEYTRINVPITVHLEDSDGNVLPAPPNFEIAFNLLQGEHRYITAPNIVGWVLAQGQEAVRRVGLPAEGGANTTSITFVFESLEDVINRNLVDVTVRGVNLSAGRATLYEQSFRHLRDTEFTAHAVLLPGFQLITSSPYTYNVGIGREFIFEYQSLHIQNGVRIYTVDASGNNVASPIWIPAVIGQPFTFNAPHIPGFHLAEGEYLIQGFDSVPEDADARYLTFIYERQPGAIEVIAVEEGTGRIIRTSAIAGVVGNNTVHAPESLVAPYYNLIGDATQTVTIEPSDNIVRATFEFERVTVAVNRIARYRDDHVPIGDPSPTTAIHRLGDIAMISAPTQTNINELEDYILWSQSPVAVWVQTPNQVVNFDYMPLGDAAITVIAHAVGNINQVIQTFTFPVALNSTVYVAPPTIEGWETTETAREVPNIQGNTPVFFEYTMRMVNITVNHLRYGDNDTTVASARTIPVQYGSTIRVDAPHIDGHVIVLGDGEQSFRTFGRIREDQVIDFVYRPISEIIDRYTVDITIIGVDRVSTLELYRYTFSRPINSEFRVYAMALLGFTVYGDDYFDLDIREEDITRTFRYNPEPTTVQIQAVEEGSGRILAQFNVAAREGHAFAYRAPVVPGFDFVRVQGNTDPDYLYGRIEEVRHGESLTFVYRARPTPPAGQGVVTVVLREGLQILMERSIIFTVGVSQTITAPDLSASHFRHEGPSSIPDHYFDPDNPATHRVFFDYVKNTTTVTVEGRNTAAGNDVIYERAIPDTRLGEVIPVSAPAVDGFTVIGEISRNVWVSTADQVIPFYLEPTAPDDVVVNMLYGARRIGSQIITAPAGTTVTVSAPDLAGAGFRLVGSESQVTVTAPYEVNFYYETDPDRFVSINITLWNTENDEAISPPQGFIYEIPVLIGTSGYVFAPHVPGYVLAESSNMFYAFDNMDADEAVTFYYVPIEYIIDQHLVDVIVRGVNDANNATLYEQSFRHPRNTYFTAHAVNLPGFRLITPTPLTRDVGSGDTFIFRYESLHMHEGVMIHAELVDGTPIAPYPIYIPAVIGEPFTFNAPHIPGFHLAAGQPLLRGFEAVPGAEAERYLRFVYVPHQGAIEVVAVDRDSGRVIRTAAIPGVPGNNVVNAPNLAPFYTLVSAPTQNVDLTHLDGLTRVTFEFERVLVSVNRVAIDSEDGAQIGNAIPSAGHRLGDIAMINAPTTGEIPELERFILDSQSPLAVWVMEANQDVNFNYTYMGDSLAVTVTARDVANTGHIIQSFTLVVDYGADITITAPVITGWMNPSPASRSLTNVQQNATVTFDYTMQTVTVTINHLRYGGGAPVAAPTVFDAQVGSLIRVYAPHIHGFVLAPGETGVHAPARLTENIEINFVYRPIEEVIDQFTAAVTIRGVDRLSNLELYSFTVRRPLNSVFEVHAMPLLGFVLSPTTPPQANPFTLNIGANPDASYTHTFSYDRAPATVRIRAEDVDGNQILEFNVAAQAGHPFSYRAPVVPGYDFVRVYGNANDDYLYGRIASVGSNDVLTFVYAPRPEPLPGQGIVTVVLREVQGIDQILMERSIIFTEDVPQTITAPSLAASHFRHEGPSSIPNHNFDPNNPATHRVYFDYVKLTTTVTVEGRSTAAGNAIVVTDTIANVRLGEVRAIDAPMHNDYIALGETPRRVLIHAPNQVVVFDMQPTTDDDVVVNMYHGALLIGRQVITALSGTQVTVNAPDLSGVGFMLVGNVSQVTVTAPAVVNFHFERDPARFVNINITLWDAENDVEIPAPSGFISNIPILRGTSGHVFAPHIPGFMLAAGSNFFYQWHDMDDNETVTFYYTPLRVGEHVVNISVYTVILDENGNIVSTTQVDAFTEHVGRTFNIWAETPPVGYRLTRRVAEFAGEPADILNLGDWGSSALPVFSVANISQSLIVRFYFEPMPDDQSVVWIEFVEYNDHATVISGLWVENVVQGEYYHYTIRRSLERFPGRLVHDASGFNGWDARVVDADDRSQIIGELRMDGYSRISFIVQPGLNVLQIPYNKAVEDIDITVRHVVRGEGRTLAEHIESGSKGREIRWNEAILDGWAAEANIPSGYIRLGVANAANIPGVADRAGIEIIIEYAPLPINNEAIIIRHVATPPDRYGEPQDEEWFLGSNIVGLLDEAAQGFQGVLMSNEVIPASQNILQNAMPETARAILIDLLPYNDLVVAELYDILTDMGFNLTPPPQQYLEYLTPPLPEEEKEEDEGEEKEEDEKDEDDEKVEEEKGADEDDKGADDEVAEEDVVVYEPEIIADVDATTIDPAVIAVILAILQDANTDIGEIISRATRTLIRGILEAADIYDIQEILSNADEGQLSDILNNHPAVEAIITELMMHYAVGGFTPKLSIVDGRLIIDVIYNLPPLEVFLDIRLESEDGEFLRNIELPYGDMPWGSVFNIFELEREEGVPLLTADDTFGFALYEPDSYVFRAQRLLLDIGAAGLSANAMANEFHARATFRQITRNIVIEYRVDGEATPVRTRTIENLPFGQYHVYFNEDGWLTDNNDYTHSYAPGHRTLVIIWYQDEDDLQDHLVEFNVTRVQGGGNGGGGGGGGGGGWLPPPPFTPPPTPPTRPEPLPQPEVEAEHYVWRRYIRGYEDGTVRPDGLLTRAEMVQMLFNLAVSSEAAMPAFGASRFSDIAADSWYFTAISYFADRGQLQGFPDGSFRPNDFITNAEFAAMATRILELDRFDFANPFAVDAGHWGAVYIARAFDRGWFVYYLEGFGPEYEFDPDGNITRAQTVALINHYTGRIPNSERIDAYLDRRQLFNDLNRSHWAFYELMKAAITHERWVYESDERWELDSRN